MSGSAFSPRSRATRSILLLAAALAVFVVLSVSFSDDSSAEVVTEDLDGSGGLVDRWIGSLHFALDHGGVVSVTYDNAAEDTDYEVTLLGAGAYVEISNSVPECPSWYLETMGPEAKFTVHVLTNNLEVTLNEGTVTTHLDSVLFVGGKGYSLLNGAKVSLDGTTFVLLSGTASVPKDVEFVAGDLTVVSNADLPKVTVEDLGYARPVMVSFDTYVNDFQLTLTGDSDPEVYDFASIYGDFAFYGADRLLPGVSSEFKTDHEFYLSDMWSTTLRTDIDVVFSRVINFRAFTPDGETTLVWTTGGVSYNLVTSVASLLEIGDSGVTEFSSGGVRIPAGVPFAFGSGTYVAGSLGTYDGVTLSKEGLGDVEVDGCIVLDSGSIDPGNGVTYESTGEVMIRYDSTTSKVPYARVNAGASLTLNGFTYAAASDTSVELDLSTDPVTLLNGYVNLLYGNTKLSIGGDVFTTVSVNTKVRFDGTVPTIVTGTVSVPANVEFIGDGLTMVSNVDLPSVTVTTGYAHFLSLRFDTYVTDAEITVTGDSDPEIYEFPKIYGNFEFYGANRLLPSTSADFKTAHEFYLSPSMISTIRTDADVSFSRPSDIDVITGDGASTLVWTYGDSSYDLVCSGPTQFQISDAGVTYIQSGSISIPKDVSFAFGSGNYSAGSLGSYDGVLMSRVEPGDAEISGCIVLNSNSIELGDGNTYDASGEVKICYDGTISKVTRVHIDTGATLDVGASHYLPAPGSSVDLDLSTTPATILSGSVKLESGSTAMESITYGGFSYFADSSSVLTVVANGIKLVSGTVRVEDGGSLVIPGGSITAVGTNPSVQYLDDTVVRLVAGNADVVGSVVVGDCKLSGTSANRVSMNSILNTADILTNTSGTLLIDSYPDSSGVMTYDVFDDTYDEGYGATSLRLSFGPTALKLTRNGVGLHDDPVTVSGVELSGDGASVFNGASGTEVRWGTATAVTYGSLVYTTVGSGLDVVFSDSTHVSEIVNGTLRIPMGGSIDIDGSPLLVNDPSGVIVAGPAPYTILSGALTLNTGDSITASGFTYLVYSGTITLDPSGSVHTIYVDTSSRFSISEGYDTLFDCNVYSGTASFTFDTADRTSTLVEGNAMLFLEPGSIIVHGVSVESQDAFVVENDPVYARVYLSSGSGVITFDGVDFTLDNEDQASEVEVRASDDLRIASGSVVTTKSPVHISDDVLVSSTVPVRYDLTSGARVLSVTAGVVTVEDTTSSRIVNTASEADFELDDAGTVVTLVYGELSLSVGFSVDISGNKFPVGTLGSHSGVSLSRYGQGDPDVTSGCLVIPVKETLVFDNVTYYTYNGTTTVYYDGDASSVEAELSPSVELTVGGVKYANTSSADVATLLFKSTGVTLESGSVTFPVGCDLSVSGGVMTTLSESVVSFGTPGVLVSGSVSLTSGDVVFGAVSVSADNPSTLTIDAGAYLFRADEDSEVTFNDGSANRVLSVVAGTDIDFTSVPLVITAGSASIPDGVRVAFPTGSVTVRGEGCDVAYLSDSKYEVTVPATRTLTIGGATVDIGSYSPYSSTPLTVVVNSDGTSSVASGTVSLNAGESVTLDSGVYTALVDGTVLGIDGGVTLVDGGVTVPTLSVTRVGALNVTVTGVGGSVSISGTDILLTVPGSGSVSVAGDAASVSVGAYSEDPASVTVSSDLSTTLTSGVVRLYSGASIHAGSTVFSVPVDTISAVVKYATTPVLLEGGANVSGTVSAAGSVFTLSSTQLISVRDTKVSVTVSDSTALTIDSKQFSTSSSCELSVQSSVVTLESGSVTLSDGSEVVAGFATVTGSGVSVSSVSDGVSVAVPVGSTAGVQLTSGTLTLTSAGSVTLETVVHEDGTVVLVSGYIELANGSKVTVSGSEYESSSDFTVIGNENGAVITAGSVLLSTNQVVTCNGLKVTSSVSGVTVGFLSGGVSVTVPSAGTVKVSDGVGEVQIAPNTGSSVSVDVLSDLTVSLTAGVIHLSAGESVTVGTTGITVSDPQADAAVSFGTTPVIVFGTVEVTGTVLAGGTSLSLTSSQSLHVTDTAVTLTANGSDPFTVDSKQFTPSSTPAVMSIGSSSVTLTEGGLVLGAGSVLSCVSLSVAGNGSDVAVLDADTIALTVPAGSAATVTTVGGAAIPFTAVSGSDLVVRVNSDGTYDVVSGFVSLNAGEAVTLDGHVYTAVVNDTILGSDGVVRLVSGAIRLDSTASIVSNDVRFAAEGGEATVQILTGRSIVTVPASTYLVLTDLLAPASVNLTLRAYTDGDAEVSVASGLSCSLQSGSLVLQAGESVDVLGLSVTAKDEAVVSFPVTGTYPVLVSGTVNTTSGVTVAGTDCIVDSTVDVSCTGGVGILEMSSAVEFTVGSSVYQSTSSSSVSVSSGVVTIASGTVSLVGDSVLRAGSAAVSGDGVTVTHVSDTEANVLVTSGRTASVGGVTYAPVTGSDLYLLILDGAVTVLSGVIPVSAGESVSLPAGVFTASSEGAVLSVDADVTLLSGGVVLSGQQSVLCEGRTFSASSGGVIVSVTDAGVSVIIPASVTVYVSGSQMSEDYTSYTEGYATVLFPAVGDASLTSGALQMHSGQYITVSSTLFSVPANATAVVRFADTPVFVSGSVNVEGYVRTAFAEYQLVPAQTLSIENGRDVLQMPGGTTALVSETGAYNEFTSSGSATLVTDTNGVALQSGSVHLGADSYILPLPSVSVTNCSLGEVFVTASTVTASFGLEMGIGAEVLVFTYESALYSNHGLGLLSMTCSDTGEMNLVSGSVTFGEFGSVRLPLYSVYCDHTSSEVTLSDGYDLTLNAGATCFVSANSTYQVTNSSLLAITANIEDGSDGSYASLERYETYRDAKAVEADSFHTPDESSEVADIINTYTQRISTRVYDVGMGEQKNTSACDDLLTEMLSHFASDLEALFAETRDAKVASVRALHSAGESDEVSSYINSVIDDLNSLSYDYSLSLSQNNQRLDAYDVAQVTSSVLQMNTETFNAYREENIRAVEAEHAVETCDNERKLINEFTDLLYHTDFEASRSVWDNTSTIDSIMEEFQDRLSAYRPGYLTFIKHLSNERDYIKGCPDQGFGVIRKAKATYDDLLSQLSYRFDLSLSENLARVDSLVASFDQECAGAVGQMVYGYRDSRVNELRAQVSKAPNPEVAEVINRYISELSAYRYDPALAYQGNVDAIRDIEVSMGLEIEILDNRNTMKFESYRDKYVEKLEDVRSKTSNKDALDLLDAAITTVKGMSYDSLQTLEMNRYRVDDVVCVLQENLLKLQAELVKAAFERFRDDALRYVSTKVESGATDLIYAYVESVKDEIQAVEYNPSLTPAENEKVIRDIIDRFDAEIKVMASETNFDAAKTAGVEFLEDEYGWCYADVRAQMEVYERQILSMKYDPALSEEDNLKAVETFVNECSQRVFDLQIAAENNRASDYKKQILRQVSAVVDGTETGDIRNLVDTWTSRIGEIDVSDAPYAYSSSRLNSAYAQFLEAYAPLKVSCDADRLKAYEGSAEATLDALILGTDGHSVRDEVEAGKERIRAITFSAGDVLDDRKAEVDTVVSDVTSHVSVLRVTAQSELEAGIDNVESSIDALIMVADADIVDKLRGIRGSVEALRNGSESVSDRAAMLVSLTTEFESLRDSQADRQQFYDARAAAVSSIDARHRSGESDAVKAVISASSLLVSGLSYATDRSLAENLAILSDAERRVNEDVTAQLLLDNACIIGDISADLKSTLTGKAPEYPSDSVELWGTVSNADGLGSGVSVVMGRVDSEGMSDSVSKALSEGHVYGEQTSVDKLSVVGAFEVTLKAGASVYHTFNGTYVVKILLPENMRGYDDMCIVYVDEYGYMEVMDTHREGDFIVFETTHFSTFTLLGQQVTVSAGDLLVVGLVIVIIVVLLFGVSTHVVRYDANGGEGAMNTEFFFFHPESDLSTCTFTKEGARFIGWSTSPEGSGDIITDGAAMASLGPFRFIHLYAVWEVEQ